MRQILKNPPLAFAFAFAATAAFAHAQLGQGDARGRRRVASATEIRLKFSEGVEPRFSGIALTAADGAASPLGAAQHRPGDASVSSSPIAKPLPPGVYTVTWSAVSTDTHHTQGDFQFTVKP